MLGDYFSKQSLDAKTSPFTSILMGANVDAIKDSEDKKLIFCTIV